MHFTDNWKRFAALSILFILSFTTDLDAQDFSIKTNIAHNAAGIVNLGIEAPFRNDRWSMDVSGALNAWHAWGERDTKYKHYIVQPEFRYWLCNRFSGHYIGFHVHGGQYNVGNIQNNFSSFGTDFSNLSDRRYQGWFAGAGFSYGYALPLDRNWNLEFGIGAGYSYTCSDVFECQDCGKQLAHNQPHHYFGITKISIGIVYLFL